MKKFIFLFALFSFQFFLGCAATPPVPHAEKTAGTWDEIYQCIRTAPPGKNCGNQFKSYSYTAKVSSIQKNKLDQPLLLLRFGSGDKAFLCPLTSDNVGEFSPGEIVQFEGTVSGISSRPMQRSVEFSNCTIRKL